MTVFLSHDSFDKPQVRAVAIALERRGVPVWLDRYSLVADECGWDLQIRTELENATHVVVFLSLAATRRLLSSAETFFGSEIRDALRHGKRIVPVLLSPVEAELVQIDQKFGTRMAQTQAAKLYVSETLKLADRSASRIGSDLEVALDQLGGWLGGVSTTAVCLLERELLHLAHDIRVIREGLELTGRFQNSAESRLVYLDRMRQEYARWVKREVNAPASLEALLRDVTAPMSLITKGEATTLRAWAFSPEREHDILGSNRLMWNFTQSLYGVANPLNALDDIICFDRTIRLEQAKLFDDVGRAIQRRMVIPETLGFLQTHYGLIVLLTYVEIARIHINRMDDGEGKAGLWFLADWLDQRPGAADAPRLETPLA